MLRTATFFSLVVIGMAGLVSGADPERRVRSEAESEVLPYEEAYRKAQQERKPLVIRVGAQWCAACQTMKRDTMEPMQESGALREVVYTQLDKDDQPELAGQVMQGKMLPQIVVFCESDAGWKRFSLTGIQTERRVKELIRKASEVLPARR